MEATKEMFMGRIVRQSIALTVLAALAAVSAYAFAEPTIGSAQVNDQFTISQTVTAEVSFLTTADDVVMDASIPGITGGTANGATQVVVMTNNAAGYTMTIAASSSPALQGDATSGEFQDYTPTGAVPDYAFTVGANTAEFAYTVEASTTSDVDPTFRDDGVDTCGSGANNTADACWYGLSTTPETIVNRTTATTGSGATTTLKFRAQITANPSPVMPSDTYTATTTLTATVN